MGTEPSVPMAQSTSQITSAPARASHPDARERIFSLMVLPMDLTGTVGPGFHPSTRWSGRYLAPVVNHRHGAGCEHAVRNACRSRRHEERRHQSTPFDLSVSLISPLNTLPARISATRFAVSY